MNAYRVAGAHLRAMPKLLKWCDEAAVAHWSQHSAEIPSWQEAHRHMLTEGDCRRSIIPRVQVAKQIPTPEPSRAERRLKPSGKR